MIEMCKVITDPKKVVCKDGKVKYTAKVYVEIIDNYGKIQGINVVDVWSKHPIMCKLGEYAIVFSFLSEEKIKIFYDLRPFSV